MAAADEMPKSPETLEENVQKVATVDNNLSQATVTDDEWAVKENAFACSPVFDDAGDCRGQWSCFPSLFEDATKSLSTDSITVEATTVPEAAAAKKVTEPVAVEQEN